MGIKQSQQNDQFFIVKIEISAKTITLKVHPQKSIKQLKRDIEKREGISWSEQQLYFKGRKLKDELSLSDYKISQKSTYALCLLPKASSSRTNCKIQIDSNITIQIFVKVINNPKKFTLYVCVTDSIQAVKKIICNKLGVNIQPQKLATSSGTPLQDELKLIDYNIQNNQTLYLTLSRLYAQKAKLKQERLKQEKLKQTGLTLSIGDKIDCRDRCGKWYLSEIYLVRLDAVYVHYIGWKEKWNEWIFVENSTVCDCSGLCDTDSHRIAAGDTQTRLYAQQCERLKQERLEQERLKRERLKSERLKQERLQEERLKKLQLRRAQLIGKRFDIYDLTIKQWWPCTVIDADHEYIKVTYDGYSSKYDEWIKNNERIAVIHGYSSKNDEWIYKHTKNQERLKQERLKRERLKQEKLERERLKQERLKQERLEQERLKRERLKQERLKQERLKQERRAQLIGKRFDIYDLTIKQWWPCTIIDADHEYIKVTYDGYSSKHDEWIKNNERIAVIHKHTKNHKMHKELTDESEKRKKEWNVNNLNMVNFSSSQTKSCLYYNECVKIMEQYVNTYGITRTMFDLSGNMCFCEECHGKRGDKETYSRGKPSQVYVLPIGYARFGIKLSSNQIKENIFEDWHVVYHGTKSAYIKEISESGLILLKPNDFKLDKTGPKYKTNKIRSGHIQQKFIRINKHTKQKETFDPEQIFTSPSCIYASKYCDQVTIDNNIVSFMFQCRQKPATYCRGQETMCFDDTQIDKFISNNCIEFYTKHNLNIAITGILIKIHSFKHSDDESEKSISDNDESVVSEKECTGCDGSGLYDIGMCFQCNGTAHCRKCKGSGIWKRALTCNKCDGSGLYRNRGKCRSCKGSGIFKPALNCRPCKGKGECVKCQGTGRFKRKCRRCDGSGVL